MIKAFSVGIWTTLVTVCAIFLGMHFHKDKPVEVRSKYSSSSFSFMRTKLMTVPIIVKGDVAGYVMSQLIYAVDRNLDTRTSTILNFFVNDEIFNILFSSYSTTREIERIKLEDIKQSIIEGVNERIGQPVLKDLFVQQFGYVSEKALRNN